MDKIKTGMKLLIFVSIYYICYIVKYKVRFELWREMKNRPSERVACVQTSPPPSGKNREFDQGRGN